ncbi:phosphotransferase [Paenibacillus lupini]|uniref:phosphotransferase family protein n=1 Tax=Paenibacillus lupini TaxID=1450204 RepID=UPI0014218DC5|nr:phosphotransferase [Paenibacillus lupini]NIK23280.1 fructosamine-3-kinase [Paenibacillus lupini]
MENANKYRLSNQEIGKIVHEAFGQGFHSASELTDGWANMAYSIMLEDGRKTVLARVSGLLTDVKEASLVHWDLWDGNIFVKDGAISGLIDFERAFWGDPLCEYYFGRLTQEWSNAFYAGYGINGLTEAEQRRRVLYDFYMDLIFVIECTYRKYENQDHIKWTHENFKEGFKRLQAL